MLAQTTQHVPAGGLIEYLTSLRLPDQAEYVQQLAAIGPLQAFALVACGAVYLLYGWKIFKLLVIANAATLGLLLGYHLGGKLSGGNMPIIGALAGGLLLAALAWPLMKYAISIMGGLAGSFIGFSIWRYVATALQRPDLNQYAWAGALIGLIALGLLAFVIFRVVVITFTSLQGALMTVSGGLGLLLKSQSVGADLQGTLSRDSLLLGLVIAVPAVIGFALQQVWASGKSGKK